MGVSRSRDDYRLGEPVIQDMYPLPLGSYFSFSPFFLDIDRDRWDARRRGPRDVRRLPEKRRIRAPTEGTIVGCRHPTRLRQDVSNFAPTIYIARFSLRTSGDFSSAKISRQKSLFIVTQFARYLYI